MSKINYRTHKQVKRLKEILEYIEAWGRAPIECPPEELADLIRRGYVDRDIDDSLFLPPKGVMAIDATYYFSEWQMSKAEQRQTREWRSKDHQSFYEPNFYERNSENWISTATAGSRSTAARDLPSQSRGGS